MFSVQQVAWNQSEGQMRTQKEGKEIFVAP
jgi:hypothetical protein